ncbi:hypothetical protein [Streptomyces sp. KMM 9044]|nr:hypothetical protein [Streptomyces sp. KMM 9044]WAX76368.1 hypothetical protein HUV60_000345 [Streptomyces sp. KMM 9044]
MDEGERERQARGVEGAAPVLRLAGVDDDEDDPSEPNVVRGID